MAIVGSEIKLKVKLHISALAVAFGITAVVVVRVQRAWYGQSAMGEVLLMSYGATDLAWLVARPVFKHSGHGLYKAKIAKETTHVRFL